MVWMAEPLEQQVMQVTARVQAARGSLRFAAITVKNTSHARSG